MVFVDVDGVFECLFLLCLLFQLFGVGLFEVLLLDDVCVVGLYFEKGVVGVGFVYGLFFGVGYVEFVVLVWLCGGYEGVLEFEVEVL